MGLKYILGAAGTGKTTEALNEMIKYENTHNDSNIIYIVPEQFSLQAEKDILSLANTNGTTVIKVLSFKRLAFNIFSETGVKKVKLLDDISKFMLIRKIIFKLKDKLEFFQKTKITKGFINKVAKSITEFYQYDINPNEISQAIKYVNNNESLILKTQDLTLIYNEYIQYISNNYISIDGTLDVLADKISESALLHNATVWIDGFNGFTNQEYKVIKELMKKTLDVTITLTTNSPDIYYTNIIETDLFYETKYTLNKLTGIAKSSYIDIYNPIFLKENKRHKNNNELKYLQENIFSTNFKPFINTPKSIKIQPLLNIYEEVSYVGYKINVLIKENGYHYSDISVLTPNVALYESIITSTFKKHNIPYFIDATNDILSHPLFELIRATLDIVIQNWSYESVFRFLKTGMLNISLHEIDILENYALAYGIKGYKWKLKEWNYGFNNNYENFNKEELHQIKEKVINIIRPFEEGLTNNAKLTVREISIKLFDMLYSINITQTIERLINDATEQKNNTLVRRHSQVWGKICNIFDNMVAIIGDEEVTIAEFSAILEAGMLTTNMGIIPPTQDQVIIGDISRSRLPKIKVLFVVGTNDGIFPTTIVEESLFTDHERLLIDSLGIELGPTSLRRAFNENFLIYTSLLKTEKLLILTYSLGALDGKAMLPAYIINHIKELFINFKLDNFEEVQFYKFGPILNKLSIALKTYYEKGEISETYLAFYKWFKKHKPETIEKIENMAFNNNKIEKLNSNSIKKLYGKEINTSVSKLEQYVRCPFSFFVSYNLKAKERKIYQILTVDLGEIFHDILHIFTELIMKDNINFEDLTIEDISYYVDICIKDVINNLDKDVFISNNRSKHILERIKKISTKSIWALCEHIKMGKFKIFGSEVSFGGNSPLTGIIVEINKNRKFVFTGRVDRIDVMDLNGNKYVKIIDYKSGNKKFDITDIYYGMQLQLLLYLDNIIKNGKKYFNMKDIDGKLLPGGVFYFKIDNPILNIDSKTIKKDLDKEFLKSFKMSGLILKDELLVKGMDKDIKGGSLVVPISLNKDGTYNKLSSLADKETFDKTIDFTINKVKEIGESLTKGVIYPMPYRKGNINACMYCNYKPICNFDPKDNENYTYNTFSKKTKLFDT